MLGTFLLLACVADMESAAGFAAGLACDGEACEPAEVGLVGADAVEVVVVVPSLVGDVGESRSFEPDESFVRFFLRKPRVGIEAKMRPLTVNPSTSGSSWTCLWPAAPPTGR